MVVSNRSDTSQNFLGLGSSAEVEVSLSDKDNRKKVEVRNEDGKKDKVYMYYDGESVGGTVHIRPKGKKLEHHGIKVEFIGQIGQCIRGLLFPLFIGLIGCM